MDNKDWKGNSNSIWKTLGASNHTIKDRQNEDYRINHINVLIILKRKDDAREELDEMVRNGTPRANLTEWYKKCR